MTPIKVATWAVLLASIALAVAGAVIALTVNWVGISAILVGGLIASAMNVQLDMIKDREHAWPTQ